MQFTFFLKWCTFIISKLCTNSDYRRHVFLMPLELIYRPNLHIRKRCARDTQEMRTRYILTINKFCYYRNDAICYNGLYFNWCHTAKRQYCSWCNFAMVGLNNEIDFSLFLKHVELLINVFCIYISSSGIKNLTPVIPI